MAAVVECALLGALVFEPRKRLFLCALISGFVQLHRIFLTLSVGFLVATLIDRFPSFGFAGRILRLRRLILDALGRSLARFFRIGCHRRFSSGLPKYRVILVVTRDGSGCKKPRHTAACVGIMRSGGKDMTLAVVMVAAGDTVASRPGRRKASVPIFYLWLRRRWTGRKRPLFGADRFSPTAAFQEAFARRVFREIPSRPIACQRPPTANEQRVVGSTGEVRTGPATRLRS